MLIPAVLFLNSFCDAAQAPSILPPGTLSIKGAKGPWGATIQKFIKLSPKRVKVVTSLKDSENDLLPIKKRP